ncbi:MAG TPA: hypothetical protein VHN82_08580, partial [Methanoregula sp.]|nr:hypothetical protein [Methanoregula sp.]
EELANLETPGLNIDVEDRVHCFSPLWVEERFPCFHLKGSALRRDVADHVTSTRWKRLDNS